MFFENSIFLYIFILFPIGIIMSFLGFMRGTVGTKIKNISGFSSDVSFIGINAGIAFNFESGTLAYTTWLQRVPVVFSHSDIAKHSNGELMIESRGKHITIHTNMYDRPMINIGFWNRNQMARCLIALRQIMQARIDDPDDVIIREKFIKALQKKIPKNSRSNRGIEQRERDGLIDFLLENTEKICSRPAKHGDNLRIAEAMFHFFGHQDDDASTSGYKLSALQKRVGQLKNSVSKKTK